MKEVQGDSWPRFKRQIAVPLGGCLVLTAWCYVDSRRLESRHHSYQTLLAQVRQMGLDAARIQSLRTAPRLATERERPNDELIAEVHDSMTAADIPPGCWVGNDPAPTVRVPRSPYKRLTVRLLLEELNLRQLVRFAYHLNELDSAISIPRIRLFAPHDRHGNTWNVDLSLSYLIYAPYNEGHE